MTCVNAQINGDLIATSFFKREILSANLGDIPGVIDTRWLAHAIPSILQQQSNSRTKGVGTTWLSLPVVCLSSRCNQGGAHCFVRHVGSAAGAGRGAGRLNVAQQLLQCQSKAQ